MFLGHSEDDGVLNNFNHFIPIVDGFEGRRRTSADDLGMFAFVEDVRSEFVDGFSEVRLRGFGVERGGDFEHRSVEVAGGCEEEGRDGKLGVRW